MKNEIFDKLLRYSHSGIYPFHMPGHKRNMDNGLLDDIYTCDITEINGFDNLHDPQSIILDAEKRTAKLYHSEESYFLVNGSTVGILSAISAVAGKASKLIIARNCHKAVYNAAFLNHMEPAYIYPEMIEDYDLVGEVKASAIYKTIEEILNSNKKSKAEAAKEIAAVVITSPTYDGIISDVKKIAKLVHEYGIPLIVDQAHGAHFGFHPEFPKNAVSQGADLVIHSIHKTLPALTQTALIHKNGNLVNGDILRKYLSIYQSSSPSYLLMASIDEAISIVTEKGKDKLNSLFLYRNEFLDQVKRCRYIRICPYTEPGKLIISTKGSNMTGVDLHRILREKYMLELEMSSMNYVTAIITMMDTKEGLQRLANALTEIDQGLKENKTGLETISFSCKLPINVPMWRAYIAPSTEVEFENASERTSAVFINLYPPGIPLIVPGEGITPEILKQIQSYQDNGLNVQGIKGNKLSVLETQV